MPTVVPFSAPLAPDTPFYVISDLHGREDLLAKLFHLIEAEVTATPTVVFVGDYVDRGEDSADILHWMHQLALDENLDITCLQGNHEDMLLRFLDDPEERGARWLRYGGLQTLSSFGVGAISEHSSPATLKVARDALADAMGAPLIEWLRSLPSSWQSGNVAVVHAGADPQVPIDAQSPRVLKWGHPDFFKVPRTDGTWVVHGHTIVDQPRQEGGRISIDTGAYATGRLTAAHISTDGVRFLQT